MLLSVWYAILSYFKTRILASRLLNEISSCTLSFLSHEHSELLPHAEPSITRWISKYSQVDGLTASPVWEVEKTGQADHLENIQDNWVVIRWAKYTAVKNSSALFFFWKYSSIGPSPQGCLQEGAEKLDTGAWRLGMAREQGAGEQGGKLSQSNLWRAQTSV